MRVCNFSSGSDGNCTYIETARTKILLDAGISCAKIVAYLKLLNVSPKDIDAIIISHEHSDHIKGIPVFAQKFKTKIYSHEKNWDILSFKLSRVAKEQFVAFVESDFEIGDLIVSPITISHDAVNTCAFSFYEGEKKISILTDLGQTTDRIINHIQNSRLVFIEANHDEQMLKNNPNYSYALKRRILSKSGHLSNTQSAQAILQLSGTKQVMLSHLSTENNTPELAYETIRAILKENGIEEGKDIFIGQCGLQPTAIFKIN